MKIAILPCNGIGQLGSTITREAAYLIYKKLPRKVALLSTPEIITDEPRSIEAAKKYPLILIEGCTQQCGAAILSAKAIKPALVISVPMVCLQKKLSLAGEHRARLGQRGMRLVEEIAGIAIEKIDSL